MEPQLFLQLQVPKQLRNNAELLSLAESMAVLELRERVEATIAAAMRLRIASTTSDALAT